MPTDGYKLVRIGCCLCDWESQPESLFGAMKELEAHLEVNHKRAPQGTQVQLG